MNRENTIKEIYIGIDESGSSKYPDKENTFVLCAVAMKKEEYEKLILNFNIMLLKIKSREIKYSKSTNNQVRDFLKIMSNIDFKLFYVIKKVSQKDSLVDIYRDSILEMSDILYLNFDSFFNIKIDEMYGEARQNIIKKKISQRLKNKNKISYTPSHKSIIVQVADMYAGLKRKEILAIKNK